MELGIGYDWIVGASIDRALNGAETVSPVIDDPWKGLVYNAGIGHTNSNLFRTEVFLKLGGQDENFRNNMDNDFYFRLLQTEPQIVMDNTPGSVYISREGYRLSELPGVDSRRRVVDYQIRVNDYLLRNRQQYYKKNEVFFRAALFRQLRIFATTDLRIANSIVEEMYPNLGEVGQFPDKLRPYIRHLYPVLGFYWAERLRLAFRRVIPEQAKQYVKKHI